MNPHPLGVAEDRTTPERVAPPSIRVESATAGYGGGPDILTGVTLELAAGATAVIQGGAGSGKSALIHLLRGALIPREGRVLLLGSDIAILPARTRAALKRRIGYIAQTPLLRDDQGAGANIMAPLTLTPNAAVSSTDVTDMLAYLGLTQVAHQPVGDLSHVQRRLTAIARAFVARPDIVLADEPLVGLGGDAGGRVLRLLSEMARQRATVVIATHAPEMFAALPAARWRLDGGALSAASA